MIAPLSIFGSQSRLKTRIAQVVNRSVSRICVGEICPEFPGVATREIEERRVCFNVSSIVSARRGHLLQYGLAALDGSALFEGCTHAHAVGFDAPGQVQEPDQVYSEGVLSALLLPYCAGARLIGFHRVLQAGLLPEAVVDAARGFACAWRRHQLEACFRPQPQSPRSSDTLVRACLEAKVEPPVSVSALHRAQAISRLWRRLEQIPL